MGRVIIDMSPSVDGYVAGRGVSVAEPFGDAGQRLHHWLGFDGTPQAAADEQAAARMFAEAGAVLIGRRMFEVGIGQWGDDGAFGLPTFVVTNRPRERLVKGPTEFTFVTEGVDAAIAQAKEAAGDREVIVTGGANLARQCLAAGHVDELRLHVVPIVLGGGTPLFTGDTPRYELVATNVTPSPQATHLTFAVTR